MSDYLGKDYFSKNRSTLFSKEVILPYRPMKGDIIPIEPDGFTFKVTAPILPVLKDGEKSDNIITIINYKSGSWGKDGYTLGQILAHIINTHKEAGWKAEVSELWQEIIDKEDK